jgi:hypothetical protein
MEKGINNTLGAEDADFGLKAAGHGFLVSMR